MREPILIIGATLRQAEAVARDLGCHRRDEFKFVNESYRLQGLNLRGKEVYATLDCPRELREFALARGAVIRVVRE